MKIIIPIILLISVLFLLSGCGEEEIPVEQLKAFIGGTEGIKIEFTEQAPPDVVYDSNYPFDINLKITNLGEWDIANADDMTVTIIGIEPESFGKTLAQLTKNSNVPLNGAHYDAQGNEVEGTITNINFPSFEYQQAIVGSIELPVVARACYEYGTKINTKICVLDDLLGVSRRAGEEPVCNPNEVKKAENSGAPVQITLFRESVVANDRISLTFEISHVGEGFVSKINTECSTAVADKDRIWVKVNTGYNGLSCSGIEGEGSEGLTTLYTGKRTIICTQPLASPRGNFEKPITIELRYGYSELASKTLTVRHTG